MTFAPTAEQLAIINHDAHEPLRVAAGAGTGKTTTIALRLESLIAAGHVAPDGTLGITFTVKAAEELAQRLRTQLPEFAEEGRLPFVTTYHGFAFSIIQEFGGFAGFERELRVITPGFSRQLLLESLGEGTYQHSDLTFPRGRVEELVGLGGELANHLLSPADLPDGSTDIEKRRIELGQVLTIYSQKKKRLGAIDFGDMIAIADGLVRGHDRIRSDLRSRYQHVLLDEYQDTNAAQRQFLRGLFGDGHPVTAVGDVGQTIYEWRGATAQNFEEFPNDFPQRNSSPAISMVLSSNHRSGPAILEVANTIRTQTGETDPVELRASDPAAPGVVSTAWFRTAVDEANWIAAEIVRLQREEGLRWKDIAVLFRKNAHIDLVRQALAAEGVPVEVASIGALVHVPEVAQLHAWLQLLERGDGGGSILRILLGPRYRLGIGDIAKLVRWNPDDTNTHLLDAIEATATTNGGPQQAKPGLPMPEGPDIDAEVRQRVTRFWAEYKELLVVAQGLTLGDLCRRVLDTTSAWIEIGSMHDAARLSARLNIYRFLDLAEQWSPLDGRPSLAAFLDYLDSLLDETAADEMEAAQLGSEDAVSLLTVHRAKGLEWEAVFLPALAGGVFPSQARGNNPDTSPAAIPLSLRPDADSGADPKAFVDERHRIQEWRTAYVATTRAKRWLIVSGAYFYSFVRPKKPSELFELIRRSPQTRESVPQGPEPKIGEGPETLSIETKDAPDPDFPQGWREVLRQRLETATDEQQSHQPRDRTVNEGPSITEGLPEPQLKADGSAFAEHLSQQQAVLFDLPTPRVEESVGDVAATSVTGLVTYATCPLKFYWSEIDRLPRRPSRRAREGTRLHRRIEMHNLGKVPLSEDLDYDAPEPGEPGKFAAFKASRLGDLRPLLVETPFVHQMENGAVRGRIDAVYGNSAEWEIVDYKSGRAREPGPTIIQLQAYALAASAGGFGLPPPEALSVTFAFLGDGFKTHTEEATNEWLENAGNTVESVLADISEASFEPTPSAACRSCDFSRVCDAGTTFLNT